MRALVVISVGDVLCENAADSLSCAARRWGAEFVVIKNGTPGYHPAYLKHICGSALNGFSQVLISDADILIRSDAPNPFELFSEANHYYAVQDLQYHYAPTERAAIEQSTLARWHGQLPLSFRLPYAYMINTGFCLFSPERMHTCAKRFSELMPRIAPNWKGHPHAEQYLWNCVLREQRVALHYMGEDWNRLRPDISGPMGSYVYHFTGYEVKPGFRSALKVFNWRV